MDNHRKRFKEETGCSATYKTIFMEEIAYEKLYTEWLESQLTWKPVEDGLPEQYNAAGDIKLTASKNRCIMIALNKVDLKK